MSIRHFLTPYSVSKTVFDAILYSDHSIFLEPRFRPRSFSGRSRSGRTRAAARCPAASASRSRRARSRRWRCTAVGSARATSSSTSKPRNPRHFDTIEGGRVHQALFGGNTVCKGNLQSHNHCFRHFLASRRYLTLDLHTSWGGGQFRHPDFPKSLGNRENPRFFIENP